ncbi:kinase-like domain, phloem protein 2-like protein [Tanacetum coccineum]
MSSPNHDDLAHLKIPLENILEATNNFGEEKNLYKGEFENIYEGQLLWSGEQIEIHVRRWLKEKWDDEKEQQFWMEIFMLSTLTHKKLVSLVGFCDENDERIIIIKLESRGSLSHYLSDPMLTWVRRLKISVGVALTLSYIHYDEPRDFSVIHRDIDSNAVLLNDDWEPILSNFDRSIKIKASERHLSFHTDKVYNNPAYRDPTYIETKSVSHKSDMYSFGILLFELLCGRKSIEEHPDNKYLTPMAIFHYREKTLNYIMDPELWKQMDPQSFNVFAQTAYDCLNEERSQRPDIGEVVTRLEEALKLQMERQNFEHSVVAAEVEVMSSNHDKGSLTSISSHVDSHVSKETKSFLKDLSHLKLSYQDIASATNNFDEENIINTDEMLFKVEQKEVASLRWRAKCKWALEGDENTKFFHNIINGRRRKQNIHGVQSNVSWVIEPNDIKRVFFDHFSCQFREPSYSRPELFSSKFKRLSVDQCLAIERPFCDEEIKTAVWECGDDKAPGLMGFFNSATSSVLINGSPSKEFSLGRGLGGIRVAQNCNTISHLQFADDVLFVGKWSECNMKSLVRILRCYHLSSGLKVDLSKSCIYGVGVTHDQVNTLAHEVRCKGPKLNGGLGIGNLKAANLALLSHWWWRIRSDKSALWNSVIVSIHGYLGGTNPHDYESTNNGYRKSIVNAGMEIHNMGFHFFEALGRKLKLHMNVVLVIDVEMTMITVNGYGIGVDPSEVEGRWQNLTNLWNYFVNFVMVQGRRLEFLVK